MADRDWNDDQRLEAYLDGQLGEVESRSIEAGIDDDPELQQSAELSTSINESIKRQFQLTADPADILKRAAIDAPQSQPVSSRDSQRRRWIGYALAMSLFLAAGVVTWQFRHGGKADLPYFEPRSLAAIYRETVADGFQPYYFCEDPARFAQVFSERHGVSLRLAEMPAGSRMLGVSYLGGLSRQTTTVLCMVDGDPVMIFVDNADKPEPAILNADQRDELHVHRRQLGELVLFEVSPLAEPRIMKFLRESS